MLKIRKSSGMLYDIHGVIDGIKKNVGVAQLVRADHS